jgi:hypothetical protein
MIAQILKIDRSAERCRWFFLAALLAFTPLSAWCQSLQDQNVEVSTGYSYLRANSSGGGGSFNDSGGTGEVVWNVRPWLGLVGDLGGYHFGGQAAGVDEQMFTYTFGSRYWLRPRFGLLHPFAQFLLGGATLTGNLNGQHTGENGFAILAGGGVDARIQSHFAIRVVEVDYLMTRFDRSIGTPGIQNDFRVSTGIVFHFDLGGR